MTSILSINFQLEPFFLKANCGFFFPEDTNSDKVEEEPPKGSVLLDMFHQQAQQVSEEA
jgi:hypothetical protein